jgi:hypothetical protein
MICSALPALLDNAENSFGKDNNGHHAEVVEYTDIQTEGSNNDPIGTRAFEDLIESNAHGGSWLDSFEDDSGIDWVNSDEVINENSNASLQYSTFKPDANTVALWLFDEGSGNTVLDETMNDHDGTLKSDAIIKRLPEWRPGKFDRSMRFNKDFENYIEVPHSNDLNLGDEFTLEAWVKTAGEEDSTPLDPYYYAILDKTSPDGFNHLEGYSFYITGGYARLNLYKSPDFGEVYSVSRIDDDRWHYIAAVWNGTHFKMHIDGVLEERALFNLSFNKSSDNLAIGKRISTIGGKMYFNGQMDGVKISDVAYTSEEIAKFYNKTYKKFGNLTSKPIQIATDMNWDAFYYFAGQPENASFDVKILDSSNYQQIPGTAVYQESGEYDISFIDPQVYPEIRLSASFTSDGRVTPTLEYWGVSFNDTNSWQDRFVGGSKLQATHKTEMKEGSVYLEKGGSIETTTIRVPYNSYFETLLFDYDIPAGTSLKVSIKDGEGSIMPGYDKIEYSPISLEDINPIINPEIIINFSFYSNSNLDIAVLYDYSLNWTENRPLMVENIDAYGFLNRTQTAIISMDLTDFEDPESSLGVSVRYRSPSDVDWRDEYLSEPEYVNSHWQTQFSPSAEAEVGHYTFNFTFNDTYQLKVTRILTDFIKVINNKPIIEALNYSPYKVFRDNSVVFNINATDIEIPEDELNFKISYRYWSDSIWRSEYITDLEYNDDTWSFEFFADISLESGQYIFNITCNDTISEISIEALITVLNNRPTQPMVIIKPSKPLPIQSLMVTSVGSTDVEGSPIEYWYRWYKNSVIQSDLDNKTIIPANLTLEDDLWRCEVVPFDGEDTGPSAWIEVKILNSSEFDTDNDSFVDSLDQFPNDPDEWLDTDEDGVGDNGDKFPTDPAASIDTDGDKYPDDWNDNKTQKDSTTGLKKDAYPNNPNKFEVEQSKPINYFDLFFPIIILIIIIVLLLSVARIGIIRKRRRLKHKLHPFIDERVLGELRNEVISGEGIDIDDDIVSSDLTRLEERYEKGEVSEETYLSISAMLETLKETGAENGSSSGLLEPDNGPEPRSAGPEHGLENGNGSGKSEVNGDNG